MTLQPNPIGPNALWRWTRQSLALLWRYAHLWAVLLLLYGGGLAVLYQSFFLCAVFSMLFFYASINLAYGVDRLRPLTLGALARLLCRGLVPALHLTGIVVLVGFALILFLSMGDTPRQLASLFYNPATDAIIAYGYGSVIVDLIARGAWLIFSGQGSFFFFFGILSSAFHYPLMSVLELPWPEARALGSLYRQPRQNRWPLVCLSICLYNTPIAAFFPRTLPFVILFAGVMTYVAFREIYLGVAQNSPAPAKESPRVAAAAPNPST